MRGQVTVTTTECQPVAPSGNGESPGCGLRGPGPVGGADAQRVRAGEGVPLGDPLPPGVDAGDRGHSGGAPGPVVDLPFDGVDAAVLGPRRPGDGDRPGLDAGERLGHVDAGERLHRRPLRVAALRPVRPVGGEPGHLEVGDPLGRGDVAEQAGHHQAGGEAVRHRQWLAVHADGEQRVASVQHGLQRCAERHAVGRAGQELVGARQHPARRSSGPSGAPSQRAFPARSPPTWLDTHDSVM